MARGSNFHNRPPYDERFWKKTSIGHPERCWLWTGSISNGYGQFWHPVLGRPEKAHRVAYELVVGPIPDGLVIDHLCRNKLCVNPNHLEVVTHKVNILRGEGIAATNARKTHCSNGHEFNEANTITNGTRRTCRACYNAKVRRRRARIANP